MTASSTHQAAGTSSFRFLLTHRRRAQGYRELLLPDAAPPAKGDVSSLTMLWIPPGRFWMGSPATELGRLDAEGPLHLVQLQGFFLGQTPITQAQWRLVAQWRRQVPPALEPMPQPLDPDPVARLVDPDRFRGDQRPVVDVSWHEANEFCRRLRQRTGRPYALPSEAQWEYACRAGTTTPFAFGETINTALANYNAEKAREDGPRGEHRQQTTDVASFPANAWGLHDMHGNVGEWCADHWHGSYRGAPDDGRPWVEAKPGEQGGSGRLVRGGSWHDGPLECRSAYRCGFPPVIRDNLITSGNTPLGFRVCCLSQNWSLNAEAP